MLHSGILLTRVFTSRGQLPVENAAVSVVLHSDSDRHTLLNIQTSDRSGNTLPTTIETPGVQNSQFPGQEAPFTCATSGSSTADTNRLRFKTYRYSQVSPASKISPSSP